MIQPKTVLVTGASGFVCRHIIQSLLHDDYHIIAVDRHFDPELVQFWATHFVDQVQVLSSDLTTLEDQPIDFVVHGAAITATAQEMGLSAEEHLRANLDITLDILAWAHRNSAQRTICVSSSAVYHKTSGMVTEEHPTTPDNLYAIAKATTESLVETLRSDFDRDVITIRLSNIYGTGEVSRQTRPRVSLITRMVQEALHTGKITVSRPEESRDWTSATDVGRAVCALLKSPHLRYGLYNVASQQIITTQALAEMIASQIVDTQITISADDDTAPQLTRHGYLSHQRLLDDIGFDSWTPLNEGVAQVIEHYRDLEVVR